MDSRHADQAFESIPTDRFALRRSSCRPEEPNQRNICICNDSDIYLIRSAVTVGKASVLDCGGLKSISRLLGARFAQDDNSIPKTGAGIIHTALRRVTVKPLDWAPNWHL